MSKISENVPVSARLRDWPLLRDYFLRHRFVLFFVVFCQTFTVITLGNEFVFPLLLPQQSTSRIHDLSLTLILAIILFVVALRGMRRSAAQAFESSISNI